LDKEIVVSDENGIKIGTTYPRRAKQLVSKQKAKWLNASNTEICMKSLQLEEDYEEEFDEFKESLSEKVSPKFKMSDRTETIEDDSFSSILNDEETLRLLAKKRIKEKRCFKWHMVANMVASIMGFFMAGFMFGSVDLAVAFYFGWVASFVFHSFLYMLPRLVASLGAHKGKAVESEYRKIRKMSKEKIESEYVRLKG